MDFESFGSLSTVEILDISRAFIEKFEAETKITQVIHTADY